MQLRPLSPDTPLESSIQDALAELDQLKAELDALRPLDPTAEARVLQKLRLDWNYHSNAIEGNQLSQGETRALLMNGLTAHGKPLKDHNEIRGHNEAILWLEDIVHNQVPLTEALLREFHRLLLAGEAHEVDALTPDGHPSRKRIVPGVYKTQPNHVLTATGEKHLYAAPEEVPALMMDLMQWYQARREQKDLHPLLVASELHYWFVYIHPFDDGNGRLSRILLNLELMRHGYPIAVIRTQDKASYITALETADVTGVLTDFYRVVIDSISRSTGIMLKAARGEDYREPDEIPDVHKKLALAEKEWDQSPKINEEKNEKTIGMIVENSKKLADMIYTMYEPFFKHFINYSMGYSINGTFKQSGEATSHISFPYPRKINELQNIEIIYLAEITLYINFMALNLSLESEQSTYIEYKLNLFNNYFYKFNTKSLLEKEFVIQKPYGTKIKKNEVIEIIELQANNLFEWISRHIQSIPPQAPE